jgi:hypothetical protein
MIRSDCKRLLQMLRAFAEMNLFCRMSGAFAATCLIACCMDRQSGPDRKPEMPIAMQGAE